MKRYDIPSGPHPDYWEAGCTCPFCREWVRRDRAGKEMLRYIGVERYLHMDANLKNILLGGPRNAPRKVPAEADPQIAPVPRRVVDKRPTWMEVVERDSEIINWNIQKDAYTVRQAHLLNRWGLVALLVSVAGLVAGLWLSLLAIPVGVVVLMGVFYRAVQAADRYDQPERAIGACPKALEIKKYEGWENSQLLTEQQPEAFRSTCPCPSCGYMDVHDMAPRPDIDTHEWVKVVRLCRVCGREWGQA